MDSEWHSFLECPLLHDPRSEFVFLTKLDDFFDHRTSIENFVFLVARIREEKRLVNALARFALQVHDIREDWFR